MPAKSASEQVTYLPGEGDQVQTSVAGIVFHANVPREVTNPAVIAMARANRFFKVGDFDPKSDRVPAEETISPKTSEQYKAHAAAWFKAATSVEQLDTKWEQEETLRMSCGVGSDDFDYLMSLFQPKRAELRKREIPT